MFSPRHQPLSPTLPKLQQAGTLPTNTQVTSIQNTANTTEAPTTDNNAANTTQLDQKVVNLAPAPATATTPAPAPAPDTKKDSPTSLNSRWTASPACCQLDQTRENTDTSSTNASKTYNKRVLLVNNQQGKLCNDNANTSHCHYPYSRNSSPYRRRRGGRPLSTYR